MKTAPGKDHILPARDFEYRIRYSRRRTLSIIVSPDKGVTVKAPHRTPAGIIEKFVNEKSPWIIKCLEGFSSLQRIDSVNGYHDGDRVMLFGEFHRLRLVPSGSFNVRLRDEKIIEIEFRHKNDPLLIREVLEAWFRFIAARELTTRFSELLARYSAFGFKPAGFSVRKMKKRWGSCSSGGMIGISYDLIRLDREFSDYVIAHELCHLIHHNHGADYYKLLSEVYPQWKKMRAELKKYLR